MINPEKTKLMSRASIFEQGSRDSQLKLKQYFEEKHLRFRLKYLAMGAFIYLLLALIVLVAIWQFVKNQTPAPWATVLIIVLAAGAGVAFTVIFANVTERVMRKRYRNIRSSLVRYELLKKKIRQFSQEGKPEAVSEE